MGDQMSTDKKPDKELDPKRRSHERQYFDEHQDRYVDLPERALTQAEIDERMLAGSPNRKTRRAATSVARRGRRQ